MKNRCWSFILGKTLLAGCAIWAVSLTGCASQKSVEGKAPETRVSALEQEDSTQYELVVLDPGFDTFLATLTYGKDYYSDAYYQSWNIRYVQEWNYRCQNPLRYGSFFDTEIPYNPQLNYGLEFNYRLYHYFLFIEKQYGVTLIHRKGK